jgi:hypothetical protein
MKAIKKRYNEAAPAPIHRPVESDATFPEERRKVVRDRINSLRETIKALQKLAAHPRHACRMRRR